MTLVSPDHVDAEFRTVADSGGYAVLHGTLTRQ